MSEGFSLRSNTLCFLISESLGSDSLGGEEMSSLGRRGCVVCFKVIFIVFLKFGSGVCQLVSLSLSTLACFIFFYLSWWNLFPFGDLAERRQHHL